MHNDPRPGYAGPSIVSIDSEGALSIARELPGIILCLKLSHVYEVDPLWNISPRPVVDLKAWLQRQFLASQGITPTPKLNPRAITTLDQIWELLAQVDANSHQKSLFFRATPIEPGSRTPVVEASVISQTHSTRAATTGAEVSHECSRGEAKRSVEPEDQNELAPAVLSNCNELLPPDVDVSLQWKNQAQQAEIARLTKSINQYGTRIRAANDDIRSLRNELRDSQNEKSELQVKYDRAKRTAGRLVHSGAKTEVSHVRSRPHLFEFLPLNYVTVRKHFEA